MQAESDARELWRFSMGEAAHTNDVRRLRRLLGERPEGEGVDVEVPGQPGATPLMVAAWRACREAAAYLLMLGADPYRRAADGRSAQNYATQGRQDKARWQGMATGLIEAYMSGRPAPRQHLLKITVTEPGTRGRPDLLDQHYREVGLALTDDLRRRLSVSPRWRKDSRSATLWLLEAEAEAAGLTVAYAVVSQHIAYRFDLKAAG